MISEKSRAVLGGALACVLGLLALGYTAKGMHGLIFGTARSDAVDLHLRWVEQRYFLRGQNPYDVWRRHDARAAALLGPAPIIERANSLDPRLGGTDPTHPPWGYLSGLLLLWPDWPAIRVYFALLNLLALAVIVRWAYGLARSEGKATALLAALAVLAVAGNCTALEVGQYGIVATALLVGALWLDQTGRPTVGGLLVGVAMLKPTIAGPFFLALLARRRFRAAAVACVYWAIGGAVMQMMTGAGPLEVLRQMLTLGSTLAEHGTFGPIDFFRAAGLDRHAATLAAMLGVLLPAAAAMILWPARSLGPAFAVAAVAGRLWTYHKNYDNIALVFLLAPLVVLALKRRTHPAALIGVLAVGSTLWIPARFAEPLAFQMTQVIVWMTGLFLLGWASRRQPGELKEPLPFHPAEAVEGSRETFSRIPAAVR